MDHHPRHFLSCGNQLLLFLVCWSSLILVSVNAVAVSKNQSSSQIESLQNRNLIQFQQSEISTTSTPTSATASIYGLRVEDSKSVSFDGYVSVILADVSIQVRFFGDQFTANTIIKFVTEPKPRGGDCDNVPSTKSFNFDQIQLNSASATIQLPPLDVGEEDFYVCVKEKDIDMPWVHQGPEKWLVMKSYEKWLPLWSHILILIVLLVLSGLFSGLNLGNCILEWFCNIVCKLSFLKSFRFDGN